MAATGDGRQAERRAHPRYEIEKPLSAEAAGKRQLGRTKDISAGGAAVYLDEPLDEGLEVALDIENLGPQAGYVVGPSRDELIPIRFDIDEESEDRLVSEVEELYNSMVLEEGD
ncbi:MAG: PilZ domain-containing protein [Rhodospirillales bacterium]